MQPLELSRIEIVLIPVIVGVVAQLVKFSLYSMKHGFSWNYLLTHGHMPSTHSAFAVSVLISVAKLEGIASGTFAVAFALAVMIIDDALRLRMYLGDQGRYLNMLVETLNLNPEQYPRLKERVGHRTSEVVVGLIFGAVLSFLLLVLMTN